MNAPNQTDLGALALRLLSFDHNRELIAQLCKLLDQPQPKDPLDFGGVCELLGQAPPALTPRHLKIFLELVIDQRRLHLQLATTRCELSRSKSRLRRALAQSTSK
jgi:hypothetical protein